MKTYIKYPIELDPLMLDKFKELLESLPKPVVGIVVNTDTFIKLKDLAKTVIVPMWKTFMGTDIYLKATQFEQYKVFYDKKELDSYLNEFQIDSWAIILGCYNKGISEHSMIFNS